MDRNTNPNRQPVELNRTSLYLGLLMIAVLGVLFSSQGIGFTSSIISTLIIGKSLSLIEIGEYATLIAFQAFLLIFINPWQAVGIHFFNHESKKNLNSEKHVLRGRLIYFFLSITFLIPYIFLSETYKSYLFLNSIYDINSIAGKYQISVSLAPERTYECVP